MRLIALPSIYDRERAARPKPDAKRYWIALAAGVLPLVAVAAFARDLQPMMGAFAAVWALCVGFHAFINSSQPMTQGEIGERAAVRALATLPDSYLVVTNYKVPGYEQIGDLDLIVVGPPGVVVVEVKNYMRPLTVDGDVWMVHNRHGASPTKSISKQIANETKALAKYLGRQRIFAPMHGIVAVNSNAMVQIVSQPPHAIVPYDTLAETIAALPEAGRPVDVSELERALFGHDKPADSSVKGETIHAGR